MQKLQKYKPRIAAFNGKCIYEIFSKEVFGIKVKNLEFGLQPHKVPDTETVSIETATKTKVLHFDYLTANEISGIAYTWDNTSLT